MRSRHIIVRLLLIACLATTAFAQEFRATVNGRVTDPTKAIVQGATVTVTNMQTNEVARVRTNSEGNYTVPFLKPGIYSIAVEAQGFKKYTRDRIELQVNQAATIDFALEVGATDQSITITGDAPLIEATKADRGQVISSQEVRELPLNGRSPYLLATLSPGVNYNGEARFSRPFDLPHSWRINGGLNQNNEFLLDGAPNNAQAGNNSVGLVPSVDAVQEFKVQTSSYDAQFGKTSGGIINVSLKSGTNAMHGTLYEFTRRSAWDANTFALNAQGKPRAGHYLWDSGGVIGGPVYIPKLYDGRNRTFFFFSYEDWRESSPETGFHSVPAPEMIDQPDAAKCGGVAHCADFSKLVQFSKTGPPVPILIYDPLSANASNRTPFSGNIIPANRINPIARKILSFMPEPNNLGNPNSSFYTNNDFFRSSLDRDRFHNWAIKVDQNIGEKHHLFFSGGNNRRQEFRQFNPVPIGQPGNNAQDPIDRRNYAATLDWVTTLSPTLIANLRVGWNRNIEGFNDLPNENFDLTSLGFPASLVNQLALSKLFGDYNFNDYTSLGRLGSHSYTNSFTLHPSVTKIYGAHTFKTGLDFRLIVFPQVSPGEHDVFRLNASRDFTRRVWNSDDSVPNGNSIASFLLGFINNSSVANIRVIPSTYQRYYAPYIQDDWKITRKLTLNLGLRMDFNLAPSERHDAIDRGFDPKIVNPEDALVNHMIADPSGGNFMLPQLSGGLLFAGVNGASRRVGNLDSATIQPRIGVAYQVYPKLVVRGGFGRYYLNPDNSYLQYFGFSSVTNVISSLDGGQHPDTTTIGGPLINNPFPGGLNKPTGSSLGAKTFLGQSFNFFNPSFKVPYVDQFSLGVQYELLRHTSLDIAYVGSRGHRLQTSKPFNEPDLSVRQKCNPLEGGNPSFCATQLPNPFLGVADFKGTSLFTSKTMQRWDLSRPFPEFGAITELGRNDGRTWYNSLQVNYRVRASNALDLSVSYTLSKQIEEGLGGNGAWLDVQRAILNRSLIADDQPHSLKIGSVWQLPFGKGHTFFNNSNGLLNRLVSGWEHTTVISYISGRPAGLPGGSVIYKKNAHNPDIDWSKSAVLGWLPCVAIADRNTGVLARGPSWNDSLCGTDLTLANFLDLNLSGDAHAPRFTNFRDSNVRQQSAPSVDMSLNKATQLNERVSLQFRAEAFNLFNKFRFFAQGFNNNTRDLNFGTIIKSNIADGSNVGFPRQIQLALKLIF